MDLESMRQNKNKVLLISHDFYPDQSPNTYRWFNVLKSWRKHNLELYVVTVLVNNLPQFEELDGIKIFRVENKILNTVKKNIANNEINSKQSIFANPKELENTSFIKKVYNLTWKKLYFPDFAFLWQKPAYKMAEQLITKHEIYNVITVSWPFSDHVVGARLKENFDINWIADTIDPFYLSSAVNNSALYKNINRIYEDKILRNADYVTVLTDKLKKKYIEIYPSLAGKIVLNHNVFVPYEIPKTDLIFKGKATILVFVGTLSPITRSPENLLLFFSTLLKLPANEGNLELHLYGNLEPCSHDFIKYEHLIEKSLFLHSFTKREEIIKILQDANAIINIGNNNVFQEPSKIVEYVYLKKKIINICTLDEDTAMEMLENYPLHLNLSKNDFNDNQKLVDALSFINNSDTVDDDLINSIIDKYLLTNVERKYFELLNHDYE